MLKTKLYFRNNKEYIKVTVWDNIDDFRKKAGDVEEDVYGIFKPSLYSILIHEGLETRKVPKCIGNIHLLKDRVGGGYVAHEIAHSVFHYCDAHGFNVVDYHDDEETFCYELTKLVSSFWDWWYDTNKN